MPEALTPGQIAYAAWWRTRYGMPLADPISTYQLLSAPDRHAWEAAAQAAALHVVHQLARACAVADALWAQIARCDCDVTGRAPVGSLCASCDSLKSLADAVQEERSDA